MRVIVLVLGEEVSAPWVSQRRVQFTYLRGFKTTWRSILPGWRRWKSISGRRILRDDLSTATGVGKNFLTRAEAKAMKARICGMSALPTEEAPFRPEGDLVELTLLLPAWQAAALETAANNQGLTAGQMMRGIIQDFFGKFVRPRPA